MSTKLIQSFVWHEGKRFFVSTINRESSALLAMGAEYAETMAWEWPETQDGRGVMVGQTEASKDSLYGHERMCRELYCSGNWSGDE